MWFSRSGNEIVLEIGGQRINLADSYLAAKRQTARLSD